MRKKDIKNIEQKGIEKFNPVVRKLAGAFDALCALPADRQFLALENLRKELKQLRKKVESFSDNQVEKTPNHLRTALRIGIAGGVIGAFFVNPCVGLAALVASPIPLFVTETITERDEFSEAYDINDSLLKKLKLDEMKADIKKARKGLFKSPESVAQIVTSPLYEKIRALVEDKEKKLLAEAFKRVAAVKEKLAQQKPTLHPPKPA